MTRIIGHRGARNLWPENSLSGFRKTADLNIAGVEFDLHLTNAGEVVVLHDPTLERTTNGIGDVAELSKTARVNTYLREGMDEHIPLFEEVLEILTKGYTYYDRVLRYASVMINKKENKEEINNTSIDETNNMKGND